MTHALTPDGWSTYDEAVPHPTGLAEVVARTDVLRTLRRPVEGASLADVRTVVVVVSAHGVAPRSSARC